MIRVNGVSHMYGELSALRNIDLEFGSGEVIGLLGLNGAGKSTLLRIVTGCMAPSRGRVEIDGRDLAANPGAKAGIGYLPETPPLCQELTVGEYLRFVARLKPSLGRSAGDAAERAMGRVGMAGMGRMVIETLSKGYRQRVGIAQALLGEPRFLVLDEPTVGLDPGQLRDVRSLIREHTERRTILLSSHILSEIEAVCDRVAILRQGKLAAFDTIAALRERFSGGRGVRLRMAGDGPAAIRVLRGVPGVGEVHLESSEADPMPCLAVAGDLDVQTLGRMSRALTDRGWTIVELRPSESALEELLGRFMN